MTAVFYGRYYGRFIEIKSKLRKLKLHKMNQDTETVLGIQIMLEHQSKRNRKQIEPQHLINYFSSRTVASNFTSIAPELLV